MPDLVNKKTNPKTSKKKEGFENCLIVWRDASYCFTKSLPKCSPPTQITSGFVVKETKTYINVAVNIRYDLRNGNYWPVDGFVIPKKTIVKIKRNKAVI